MKFALKYLLLLVFWITTGNLRRLTSKEMMQKLSELNITTNEEVKKCLPALQGEWYSTYNYYYMICAIGNPSEHNDSLPVPNKPNVSACSNFDCWESQLTETAKIHMLHMMNDYRNTVGTGECDECLNEPRLVFELTWNKQLENEAIAMLEDCPPYKSILNYDPKTNLHKYMVATSFQVPTGRQIEMRVILRELISENDLQEWDISEGNYKTGLMHEVGCSFVMRRDINYTSALGENVTQGNIGHLACIYSGVLENTTSPRMKASEETCSKILPKVTTFPGTIYYSNSSYYSSLCKAYPSLIENSDYDVCSKPSKEIYEYCNQSKQPVPEIWSEKVFGLVLRFVVFNRTIEAECLLPPKPFPKVDKKYPNSITYNCTLQHEVVTIADPNKCPDWNCQDSQLTDSSKIQILNYLNGFRNSIAIGNCSEYCSKPQCLKCTNSYCNIASLQWHWYLEWQASRTVRECPTAQKEIRMRVFRNTPFPKSTIFEEIILHFQILSEYGQLSIDSVVKKLFWRNGFSDWEEDDKTFRRSNALWIGCAFIIRPPKNSSKPDDKPLLIHAHLVCIYAALSEFKSLVGNANNESCCNYCPPTRKCRIDYTKNKPPYTNLCSPVHFEVQMNCEARKEFCPHDFNESLTWNRGYFADFIAQHLNGSFSQSDRLCTACNTSNPYHKKYCYILFIIFIIVVAVFCFVLSFIFKYKVEERVFNEK